MAALITLSRHGTGAAVQGRRAGPRPFPRIDDRCAGHDYQHGYLLVQHFDEPADGCMITIENPPAEMASCLLLFRLRPELHSNWHTDLAA